MKLFLKGLYGRTRNNKNGSVDKEPLNKHLKGTATYAKAFCAKFGAKNWGWIAGLFHDAGKSSLPFQNRLNGAPERVNHSTFGGKRLYEKVGGNIGKALAYIILGHHGGLMNSLKGQSKEPKRSSLHERLVENIPDVANEYQKEFDSISIGKLRFPKGQFKRFVFLKMLFSSLVDADRLDSERYNSPNKSALRKYESLTHLYRKMSEEINRLSRNPSPSQIDKVRTGIQIHIDPVPEFIVKQVLRHLKMDNKTFFGEFKKI
jgi:CRISPR-associated endonuclease Cas3-HD